MKTIVLIALFAGITSCKTLNTYHYEDKIDGTTRTIKDDGETQEHAYWIKTNKRNVKRIGFFISQRERVYLPRGYNYIINDSAYVSGKHKYHRITYINEIDTLTTYFLINEKQ